ncbi:MAG: hypothetical protein K6F57_03725 [Candidatus Saccharibacteria bacterium]|nr:hypothetical protein [Candidatus Saccharibacteria bacterium]
MANDSFVDILVTKWLDANRALQEARPQDPTFLQLCNSIERIEGLLHERGLILINSQWAYPISGLDAKHIECYRDPRVEVFTSDFSIKKMNDKIVADFTFADAEKLRPEFERHRVMIPDANIFRWLITSRSLPRFDGPYLLQNSQFYYRQSWQSQGEIHTIPDQDNFLCKIRLVTTNTESSPVDRNIVYRRPPIEHTS